jgi:hypothetical protein
MLHRTQLAVVLGAACAALLFADARPAVARDLVKATAALALADEEPPPTRSEMLEKSRREEAAKARTHKEDDTPAYKKWWFWTLTAVVVGGTVALGAWAVKPSTPAARPCATNVIGCFGDGR